MDVPAGFESDGASIPRLLWPLIGPPISSSHLIPAVVHDYLCDTAETYPQRLIGDAVFRAMLLEYEVPRWKRAVMWAGVFLQGRFVWRPKVLAILLAILVSLLCATSVADKRPPAGWTTQATVTRVLDGDTLEVEITRKLKVRLLDCWAPEKREAAGPASTANLKRLIGDGEITLMVPVRSSKVEDVWTFGRVLGYVWSKADADWSVNEQQVRQGHATKEKVRR